MCIRKLCLITLTILLFKPIGSSAEVSIHHHLGGDTDNGSAYQYTDPWEESQAPNGGQVEAKPNSGSAASELNNAIKSLSDIKKDYGWLSGISGDRPATITDFDRKKSTENRKSRWGNLLKGDKKASGKPTPSIEVEKDREDISTKPFEEMYEEAAFSQKDEREVDFALDYGPKHSLYPTAEHINIVTPENSIYRVEVEAAYSMYIDAKSLILNANTQHKGDQLELIYMAHLQIGLADLHYSEDKIEDARSLISSAAEVVSLAIDFTPGLSAVKSVLEVFYGYNPITFEQIPDTERTIIASTFFLPSVLTGSGKVLKGIVKNFDKLKKMKPILKGQVDRFSRIFDSTINTDAVEKVEEILSSAARLGLNKSSQFGEFIKSSTGKTWKKIKVTGKAAVGEGYKFFNKETFVRHKLPLNGEYARVVDKRYAGKIRSGELALSRDNPGNEAFITALDDIGSISNPADYAERLSLYTDSAGKNLVDTSDYVVLKFRFKTEIEKSLRTPFETLDNARKYGFFPGGSTAGGAREWLIDNDAVRRDIIEFID